MVSTWPIGKVRMEEVSFTLLNFNYQNIQWEIDQSTDIHADVRIRVQHHFIDYACWLCSCTACVQSRLFCCGVLCIVNVLGNAVCTVKAIQALKACPSGNGHTHLGHILKH